MHSRVSLTRSRHTSRCPPAEAGGDSLNPPLRFDATLNPSMDAYRVDAVLHNYWGNEVKIAEAEIIHTPEFQKVDLIDSRGTWSAAFSNEAEDCRIQRSNAGCVPAVLSLVRRSHTKVLATLLSHSHIVVVSSCSLRQGSYCISQIEGNVERAIFERWMRAWSSDRQSPWAGSPPVQAVPQSVRATPALNIAPVLSPPSSLSVVSCH